MKKIFRKKVEILTTSLLCGLAFTCVNVSAMEKSEEKKSTIAEQQVNNLNNINTKNNNKEQISQNHINISTTANILKSENNNDIHIDPKIENEIKQEIMKHCKEGLEYIINSDFDNALKTIESMEAMLKNKIPQEYSQMVNICTKNLEMLKEYYYKKINRKQQTDLIKTLNEYHKKILECIINNSIDIALKDIEEMSSELETKKYLLSENNKKKYYNTIKTLKECLERKRKKYEIEKTINDFLNSTQKAINEGNFNSAKDYIEEMIPKYEALKKYLNDDDMANYYNKIKIVKDNLIIKTREIEIEQLEIIYNKAINLVPYAVKNKASDKNLRKASYILEKIIENKERNINILTKTEIAKFDEKIKNLEKIIEEKKIEKEKEIYINFTDNYEKAMNYISNKKYVEASSIIIAIAADRRENEFYLCQQSKDKIDKSLTTLRKNINKHKNRDQIYKFIHNKYETALSLINSANLNKALSEIKEIKNTIEIGIKTCLTTDDASSLYNIYSWPLEEKYEEKKEEEKRRIKGKA